MARAEKTPRIATAATMTDVPKGARPEEFLTDEDLVGFYARQLEGMAEDDPAREETVAAHRRARRAAAANAEAIREAQEDAELELDDEETPA